MKHGDDGVISGNAVIIWDGITQPEVKDDGKGGKFNQYSLKVAVPNTAPELAELDGIAKAALAADSTFRGQLPPGGNWPLNPVDPNQFEDKLPAHIAFNCKSRRAPQVFDNNGQELNPMVYGPLLYPGAVVQVLVNAYTFNNVSKGVTFGLSGIKIVDASAPRLPVGGMDASAVFGAGAAGGGQAGYQPPPTLQYAQQAGLAAPQPYGGGQQYAQQAGLAAPQPYGGGQQYAPQAPVQGYAPPGPPVGVQPPPTGYPAGGVQPAPNFLAPPPAPGMPPAPAAHQMTAKAGGMTYEQFRANPAWTDELLRSEGYML